MADMIPLICAGVVELADAHGSGPCGGNSVEVRVLSPAFSPLICYGLPRFPFSVQHFHKHQPNTINPRGVVIRNKRTFVGSF